MTVATLSASPEQPRIATPVSIERCGQVTPCRQKWDALETMKDQADVRFCAQCQRAVFLARCDAEFDRHAELGRCVAVEHGMSTVVDRTEQATCRAGAD